MENLHIPEGYQTVMPYLIIPGAEKFLAFTKKVFGAVEKHISLREDDQTIAHGEIIIGGSTIMFAESSDQFPPQPAGMYIHVANADESYKDALEADATSIMPPADQPYGRSCGVTDPCGNTWWITTA
jgi:PhnB protein